MQIVPDFIRRVRGIRMRGTLAKVNYAVSSLPRFAGLDRADEGDQRARLSGGVRLCSGMTALERAFGSGVPACINVMVDPTLMRRSSYLG